MMTVREVVEHVQASPCRAFTCVQCGRECRALVPAAAWTGRRAVRCEDCNPISPVWRRERAERPLRQAILTLADQVAQLQNTDVRRRARLVRRPGAPALAAAVRQVCAARGADELSEALLTVAAHATAWEATLHDEEQTGGGAV